MNEDLLYEIYRACRLCGTGAGFKMPIIQHIFIDVDQEEVQLEKKISDCVQIEVHHNDRMPPLICERCVDKIHDFYEFRRMCQETNRKTQQRLGLPLQQSRNGSETDCIVGVREPLNSDSDEGQPLAKHQNVKKKPKPKPVKVNREIDCNIKIVGDPGYKKERSPSPVAVIERRETRQRAVSPRRTTRHSVGDNGPISDLQGAKIVKPTTRARLAPKSALKRDRERHKEVEKETAEIEMMDDSALLVPRSKRSRDCVIEAPTPVKKTKMTTEPSKQEKTSRPGPKSAKEALNPTPTQKQTPKAGPKSKKLDTLKIQNTDPVSAAKSRRSELSELAPRTKKPEYIVTRSETTPKPGPKSKKREISPVTSLSSKNIELVSTPTAKGKKREDAPAGPKSRRQRELTPTVTRAPSPAPKARDCEVCGFKTKGAQYLAAHIKSHDVTYTPVEMSCNACELWFPNISSANQHHRRHTAMSLPYTCAKCYDDFKTPDDYELHFTRNQCLPTYEVPDVKCEECWKTFPTYKLLEDHKCPGEGARPGGKCPKCKRFYAYQRSLAAHELRCTHKRKGEPKSEVAEDASLNQEEKQDTSISEDLSSKMLPMQVRIVRCDTLLTASEDGCYDAGGISHKFGLDRGSTYPYLFTPRNLKSEPATAFDPMVAINDEIKQEYLNSDENFVHWDTDNDCDSDDNTMSSSKSADSLSAISLKTLFSPKYLGKIPKKKRIVKTGNASPSIDIRKNIIENLTQESNNSDSYDSDSILDKNLAKKDSGIDVFYNLKKNMSISNLNTEMSDVKSKEIDRNEVTDSPDNVTAVRSNNEESNRAHTIRNEGNTQNNNKDISLEMLEKQDSGISEIGNDSVARVEDIAEPELPQTCDNSELKESDEQIPKTTEDSHNNAENNSLSTPKNGHIVTKVTSEKLATIDDKASCDYAQNVENDVEMSEGSDKAITNNHEKKIDTDTDSQISEISKPLLNADIKIVDSEKSDEEKFDDVKADDINDTFGKTNDVTTRGTCGAAKQNENDVTCEVSGENDGFPDASNDKTNENDASCAQNEVTDHSNTTETCSENVKSGFHLNEVKDNVCTSRNDDKNPKSTEDTLISENELFGNRNIESVDKFNINNLDDEDKLLMAELDAQIGENQPQDEAIDENNQQSRTDTENKPAIGENIRTFVDRNETGDVIGENGDVIGENSNVIGENDSVVFKPDSGNTFCTKNYSNAAISNEGFTEDKMASLNALINKQEDLKSLDLDSISDEEFNFDI